MGSLSGNNKNSDPRVEATPDPGFTIQRRSRSIVSFIRSSTVPRVSRDRSEAPRRAFPAMLVFAGDETEGQAPSFFWPRTEPSGGYSSVPSS